MGCLLYKQLYEGTCTAVSARMSNNPCAAPCFGAVARVLCFSYCIHKFPQFFSRKTHAFFLFLPPFDCICFFHSIFHRISYYSKLVKTYNVQRIRLTQFIEVRVDPKVYLFLVQIERRRKKEKYVVNPNNIRISADSILFVF